MFSNLSDSSISLQQQGLAVDLDFGLAVFREQDAVAGLDLQGADRAVFEDAAGADRNDFAFEGLFLGRVGDDDPTLGRGVGLDALDEDAVVERTKLVGHGRLRR